MWSKICNMITRRRFLQSVAVAAVTPARRLWGDSRRSAKASLLPDPDRIINLPDGFSYAVVSLKDRPMSDGLRVPGAHDGMAAFEGKDGRLVLVCNHELNFSATSWGPFGDGYAALPESFKLRLYDRGGDVMPGLGGTTTTIYNPKTRQTERQFLSLGGTEFNCAGGKTPWGSWLSCEECFQEPGRDRESGVRFSRDRRHGYVFEVPSSATELVDAIPLKDLGRFIHEAAAVHEPTGIVYLTEDRLHSLFYRFIPNVPGQLQKGGRLQALAISGQPSIKTHNWRGRRDIPINESLATHWIDLPDPDSGSDDLRKRGAAAGAATFARGEGLTDAGDRFAFACTIGGRARMGQVFSYKPSPYEGTADERASPGGLTLIAEGDANSLLRNCDNLTMAPWGDLLLCEDTNHGDGTCAIVGIRPDGSQYLLAHNAYSKSELAGACFSPDGNILFVNIQYPGMTLAITGPWPRPT